MSKNENKIYNLEDRTYNFTKKVINYVNTLPKTIGNREVGRQVVRSSGSVGANYIEANEALSKKDFKMRIKIARKESKESRYWLRLTEPKSEHLEKKET
jgi:four helix bundle protein